MYVWASHVCDQCPMLYREMVQLRSEGSRGGNRPDIRLTPVPALCLASMSGSGLLSGNLAGYLDSSRSIRNEREREER